VPSILHNLIKDLQANVPGAGWEVPLLELKFALPSVQNNWETLLRYDQLDDLQNLKI